MKLSNFLCTKSNKMKKRAGFTLIEMVIVVTIIGIISGIAAIKYSKAQSIAKLNADYANASVIATAANLYKETTGANSISLKELKDKGYLQNIPKVQSEKGKDFTVSVDKDSENNESIVVKVDNKTFYPREDNEETQE